MKFFGFLTGKTVDAYARQLAQDFFKVCSRPMATSGKDKVFEKKADQVLLSIYVRAKAFRSEHRLSVINRARFAKSFQDEMLKLGYEPELAKRVTTALVTSALLGK
jgi:hypothetical protein